MLKLLLIISVLLVVGLWLFRRFYQQHIQGDNAPEQMATVVILDKQIVDIPDALPEQEPQEFWIYVQKKPFGPKREFQVGVHYFYALNPGDKGVLTYQGTRFLHFALQR